MKLHRFIGYVQEVQKVFNHDVLEHLNHFNSLLHNAVLTCRATISVPFEQKVTLKEGVYCSGQNLRHQRRSFIQLPD